MKGEDTRMHLINSGFVKGLTIILPLVVATVYCGIGEEEAFNNGTSGSEGRTGESEEAIRVGIMPGTLWCGDGSLAKNYTSIGGYVGADRCCRDHDGCPFIIDSMSSKYGLFNYRMHTISHCACDERFRSCLKQTGTSAANFVGNFFFNVAKTKCFTIKGEKVCAQTSWWGRCLKYEMRRQAYIRNAMPY